MVLLLLLTMGLHMGRYEVTLKLSSHHTPICIESESESESPQGNHLLSLAYVHFIYAHEVVCAYIINLSEDDNGE